MYKVNKEKIIASHQKRRKETMEKTKYTEHFLKNYAETPIKQIKDYIINTDTDTKIKISLDELTTTELMNLYYRAQEKRTADVFFEQAIHDANKKQANPFVASTDRA